MMFNEQNSGVFYQMLDKVLMSLSREICMQKIFFLFLEEIYSRLQA